jgi:hypothetical protein
MTLPPASFLSHNGNRERWCNHGAHTMERETAMTDGRPAGKHRIAIDIRKDVTMVLGGSTLDDDGTFGTSRYVRRSAKLPHLGDAAEHDVVEEMETLRRTKVGRRRSQEY